MTKTILVIPDQHAHPNYHNKRADYLGRLILDLKPDLLVNLGDCVDLPSLSTYDKGKASFHGKNYEKDINSHLDFQERLWHPIRKAKRRRPTSFVLEGNHEHRIKRALEIDPQLSGEKFGISFNNLELSEFYNEVIEYEGGTPGILELEGILFAHYFISGVMGRAIGGEHHAYSLISKNLVSSVCGHSHTADFAIRTTGNNQKVMGLVAGCYQDYSSEWAGVVNHLWWSGVVILRNVENGQFSPQFVSIKELENEYGQT